MSAQADRERAMLSIDDVAQKYRSLHLTAIAGGLGTILSQAEANEVSYLQMTNDLIEQELRQRNHKRIEQNKRRADFPVNKSLDDKISFFRLPSVNGRLTIF